MPEPNATEATYSAAILREIVEGVDGDEQDWLGAALPALAWAANEIERLKEREIDVLAKNALLGESLPGEYEAGYQAGLAAKNHQSVERSHEAEWHDCDDGFVCCDGCRHVGHVKDLPENHATFDGSTLESRLRSLQHRIRRSDVYIAHFPSPPLMKSEIVDLLVEAATVVGIQRGMLAAQNNANNGGEKS